MNVGNAIGWTIGAFVLMLLFAVFGFLCETAKADTKEFSGITDIDDAAMKSVSPDDDFSICLQITVDNTKYMVIRVNGVAAGLGAGATIDSAVCSLYVDFELGAAITVSAYRIFKPWFEGGNPCDTDPTGFGCEEGCSWNDWGIDDCEWTTAGASCADDDGSDNNADGGTCVTARRDRKATAEDAVVIPDGGAAQSYGWHISTTLAQGWYDGTINEEGIILIGSNTNDVLFNASEKPCVNCDPRFFFWYTTEAPSAGQVIIIHRR